MSRSPVRYSAPIIFTAHNRDAEIATGLFAALRRWAQNQGLTFIGEVRGHRVQGRMLRLEGEGLQAADMPRIRHWLVENVAGGEVVMGARERYRPKRRRGGVRPGPSGNARGGVIVTMALPKSTDPGELREKASAFAEGCRGRHISAVISISGELTPTATAVLRRHLPEPIEGGETYLTVFATGTDYGEFTIRAWYPADVDPIVEWGWEIGAVAQIVQDLPNTAEITPLSRETPVRIRPAAIASVD